MSLHVHVVCYVFLLMNTILVAGTGVQCGNFLKTQILGINTELAEWDIGLGGELSL